MTIVRAWMQNSRIPKLTTLLLVLMLTWSMLSPFLISAFAGFGGYISEKLLGDGANEALYLGDGTNDLTVVGSAPIVSTVGATSSSAGNIVTMTMTGNLQNLNGMPRADTWFRWGYAPDAMVNTTAVATVSGTGEQTADINPDAGKAVYYRFVASTDGVAYGVVQLLSAFGGGRSFSYWMLNTLLPIVVATVILVATLLLTGSPILSLTASVIGLIGFYIVLAIVNSI